MGIWVMYADKPVKPMKAEEKKVRRERERKGEIRYPTRNRVFLLDYSASSCFSYRTIMSLRQIGTAVSPWTMRQRTRLTTIS